MTMKLGIHQNPWEPIFYLNHTIICMKDDNPLNDS